jgi:STAS domain
MSTKEAAGSRVDLPPPLTIRHAEALRGAILAALEAGDQVVLNVPSDAAVDLSFVQLVESARIYAGRKGCSISLATPAEGVLLDVLQAAGFLKTRETTSFWLHRGECQ